MCGIIGIFNRKSAEKLVEKGLKIINYRGKDCYGICSDKELYHTRSYKFKLDPSYQALGHCLHSVVSFLPQPLLRKGKFASNCEIYNWKKLKKKYNLKARNDAELLFKLIEKKGINDLKELDGVYAFAYWLNNTIYLARDLIGVKPIWYSHTNGFAFASEKKALEKLGYIDVCELNPRTILKYNITKDKISFSNRKFFSITPEYKYSLEKIKKEMKVLITNAIEKRIPKKKFGLLFSGGIDSTLLALIFKKLGKDFICYTAALDHPGMKIPEDLIYAERVAKALNLKLKIIKVKLKDIEKYLKKIVPLIEDSNVVKVGVALTFYIACEVVKKDKRKVIFSGLGSEEIFGGYQRHKYALNINKECMSGLLKMYERDTYRDDVITIYHNLELRLPFLDKKLVDFSLKIPERYKIKEGYGKFVLRKLAEDMGLNKEFAWRRKKAAQYGSKFDRAITKLAKKHHFKYKSEYLKKFYKTKNLRLGALVSSGKDSLYATYIMSRQNYNISCLITLISKNPDSYMFHTPNVHMVELQAKAMELPLIIEKTEGKKEKELKDLKKALQKAKKEYKIEGVVTGALYSTYQRDRIEKICDELGLKIFSPLWHINQETEMRELVVNDFEVILSSIAADCLDKSWLNKRIDMDMIDKLVKINEKIGINIAFEGGEAESLVLDCPLFKKRIKIREYQTLEESKHVANLIVKKTVLVDK